jgi:sugar phosphate isomerase/epimerase
MSQPTASVQLIVFGQRGQNDFDGVLRDVAAAGFPAIEAGNLFTSHGEENVRHLLDQHGLRVSGAHFGYGDYADTERLKTHIAYAKSIGIQNLMCSGVSDGKTIEGYKQSARVFNEVGKQLAEEGLTFNYHNHAWEFDDLGGTNGMEILDTETDPKLVKYNLDVFWIYYGGQDPVAFIQSHSDRTGYFHFKDGRKVTGENGKPQPDFLELGRGAVDLKAAMQAALQAGAQWIVAEQDSTLLSPAESVAISRKYLRDELGV